ncbi:hypothetical protein [Parasphingorhabdus litoris]|nr:hypothetical protein [Parasphingorhabdus litoris]
MSIAAGAAKILQVPNEAAFFEALGLGLTIMMVFGIFQVAAGLLSAISATRIIGLGLMGLAFLISAAMIWLNGQIVFALLSFLPALLADILLLLHLRDKRTDANIVHSQ